MITSEDSPSLVTYAPILEVPGTPDVHLRAAHPNDTKAMFELIEENRAYLEPYQTWTRAVRTLTRAQRYTNAVAERHADNSWMQYYLIEGQPDENGPMAGAFTIYNHIPEEREACVGYWVAEKIAGQGVATRAASRVLDYGSERLGIEWVGAHIAQGNYASERLAQKIGFTLLGGSYELRARRGKIEPAVTQTVHVWGKTL